VTQLPNTIVQGDASLPSVVIAHGLFGSARNWGVISKRLSDIRRVIAVDMRNHGDSFWHDAHGYEEMAEDLAAVIEAEGGKADVLGHSMGGKAAMVLALSRPELVDRLIVADIAPTGYSHTQMHVVDAMRETDLTGVTRRTEADQRMAPHLDDPALRAFLLQSLNLQDGEARWKLNVDVLGAEMTRILDFPDVSGQFLGPVTFINGALSDYVGPAHHDKIATLFPNARFIEIDGAGHWVHAEKPREFEEAVRAALG
jgi:esterase